MNRIITWFVHNPVAANLLMMVLVAGGALSLPAIHLEGFPSIDTEIIRVSVIHLGATPEEVEESVCVRIEEAVDGAEGIDRLTSLAVEGICVATIELVTGTDTTTALDEIKNRVDAIDTFPLETEKPIVSRVVLRSGVVQIAVSGDADERSLKVLGQQLRDEIASLPGVSQVDLSYVRPYEISIEVPEETLRRHGLTLSQVAEAVRRSSLDLPGGSVKTRGGEILLRTKGQAYRGSQFEDLIVLADPDGTIVRLGEIADIEDGFEDLDLSARFNGKPAVIVEVKRAGDEDIVAIASQVYAYLEQGRFPVPEGIELSAFDDESEELEARLRVLTGNARSGLILVFLVLGVFLRFRLAMWVAAGVPIALLGALMLFPAMGLSISTLSVMASILVLGILVDDAIVVGESVYSRERRGEDQIRAAIDGTLEVSVPVIFGVLTTIAAFLPLVMVAGRMGQFFEVIGFTAILGLIFSLIESQLILPAHLAHRRTSSRDGRPNAFVRRWIDVQGRLASWLEHFARDVYGRGLQRAIEWRYVTLAAAIGALILAMSLFASGRMRYQFFPSGEGDIVFATITMPRGTPVEATAEAVRQLEAAAEALRAEIDLERDGPSAIVQTLSTLGTHQYREAPHNMSINAVGAHLAEVSIELLPAAERGLSSSWIAERWRELSGPIPDAVESKFSSNAFSAGSPIHFELRGQEVEVLTLAAASIKGRLASYAGVSDIADSFRLGKQEIQLAIRPEAELLGLTLDDLARQVRSAFYGEEAQRIQRGRDDLRVMVRYPDRQRHSLADLEEMRIRTADGTEVPFSTVAVATRDQGYATIRRTDRLRVIDVTADVNRVITTPERVLADLEVDMPSLLAPYPGVTFTLAGEQREHGQAMGSLMRAGALALLLIYTLLAIPLRSYLQPLIIMSIIPFGAVGAILGHLVMGWDLVFFSVLGIVALSGVVVNASLVLVHYVNRRRMERMPLLEAVASAGVARFRPIALTSITTYVGLIPLMFESDLQARMLIPMAISLGYGVLAASVFTLFLVPCLYVVLDDLHSWRGRAAPESLPSQGVSPAAMR